MIFSKSSTSTPGQETSIAISLDSTSDFPSFHSSSKPNSTVNQPKKTPISPNDAQPQKKKDHPSVAKSSQKDVAKSSSTSSASNGESSQLSLASLLSSMSTSKDYLEKPTSSNSSSTADSDASSAPSTTTKTSKPTTKTPPGFQVALTTTNVKPLSAENSSTQSSTTKKPPPGFGTSSANGSRESTPPQSFPLVKPPPGLAPNASSMGSPATLENGSWAELDAGDSWTNANKIPESKSTVNTDLMKSEFECKVVTTKYCYIQYT